MSDRVYICIDLKSFYASVECVERGLDPLRDNLVVADPNRTHKTICLAITPAMKALGIRNRCRLFEIPPEVNCVIARPRMRLYMQRSAEIYAIYLRYVSPEDVHVYSIDECFIDATPYLRLYDMDARSFARMLIEAVFKETHICATAGVGPNLFLAKVALDVTAKHASDGIGFLDEMSFRETVWLHEPITDIWQIGPGIARRLAKYGVCNLAGVAAMDKKVLYREFGKNAEYLIDHAWGQEPCTMADIASYTPQGRSVCNGQVLSCDYSFDEARMVMREMVDASVLDLVEQGLAVDCISLRVGYARERRPEGDVIPHSGGSRKLGNVSNSRRFLMGEFEGLFDETTIRHGSIRRIQLSFGGLVPEEYSTLSLFDDVYESERERSLQRAIAGIRGKFGGNAMLRLASLQEKATARERNEQVGGHHA